MCYKNLMASQHQSVSNWTKYYARASSWVVTVLGCNTKMCIYLASTTQIQVHCHVMCPNTKEQNKNQNNPHHNLLHKFGWKWVFFQPRGCWAIRGSGHLALITQRGGATPKLLEPLCLVSSYEACLVIRLSSWLLAFLSCVVSTLQCNSGTGQVGWCSLIF